MENYQEIIKSISLSMGAAWASGINLYATLALLGILGATGNIDLPENLLILQQPLVIAAASLMYLIEFFADKTPGVDTGWDTIHTFIRVPAGVLLAAGAVGEVNPSLVVAAAILGGVISGTSHAFKAGSRVLINTSPEPFSNWTASVVEDVAVVGGIWTALHYPLIFFLGFLLFILISIWLIPRLLKGIKALLKGILNLFKKPSGRKGKDSAGNTFANKP